MINNINTQKSVHSVDRNIDNSKTANIKSTKASAVSNSPVIRNSSNVKSAASLAASLGLPADKLSSSIISYARFFSLPLKPEMLAEIRRQVLCAKLPQPSPASSNSLPASPNQQTAQNSANTAETSSLLKMRETLSLAAAAAESKGVELNIKGLETYAETLDPDWLSQRSFQQKQHNEEGHHGRDNNKDDKEEKKQHKENEINADVLKKIANEFATNNKLLNILNKLSSKNGRRWLVMPFEFFDDGKQYIVSMRVLMEDSRAYKMAIQITVNSEQLTEKREQFTNKKWLFGFEFANNQVVELIVYHQDKMNEKEQNNFKKELSKYIDVHVENILIKYSQENFPYETNCNEKYFSINEAM